MIVLEGGKGMNHQFFEMSSFIYIYFLFLNMKKRNDSQSSIVLILHEMHLLLIAG